MKCNSCQEEISPKFSHAISTNSCPFCGEEIMSQKLRDILTALKEVFIEAADHMEQVEDWLAQNFQFKKVGDDQVVIDKAKLASAQTFNFSSSSGTGGFAVKRSSGTPGGDRNNIQPQQTVFAQRAGVKIAGRDAKKEIDFIMSQGGGAADPSEFVGTDEEGEEVSVDASPTEPLPPMSIFGDNPLSGLFDTPEERVLEMEKLKRLQRQDISTFGGASKINRND